MTAASHRTEISSQLEPKKAPLPTGCGHSWGSTTVHKVLIVTICLPLVIALYAPFSTPQTPEKCIGKFEGTVLYWSMRVSLSCTGAESKNDRQDPFVPENRRSTLGIIGYLDRPGPP